MDMAAIAAVTCFCLMVAWTACLYFLKKLKIWNLYRKWFTAPGWDRVAEVFKSHVIVAIEGEHCSGSWFAVYRKGRLVVECGSLDKTTLCCIYGCTKGIGAIVVAILVDRGLLDYSSPVASYWPEFAANRKESITVEQLLSHQAGLIVLDEVYTLFDVIKEPEKMSRLLANARPQWKPGTAHGFHSITIGLYMDQLVRRVDPLHRSIDKFFTEEVSVKFGIDCFIGLPKKELSRCVSPQKYPINDVFKFLVNPKYSTWVKENEPGSNLMFPEGSENLHLYRPLFLEENPAFREIPCASTNGYATATGLAQLYGILANGGRHKGQTLLSSAAVKQLNEPLVSGADSVFLRDTTYGRGTVIMESEDGHNIFGHPGFCGQAGFADPKHKIGWAYITNRLSVDCYAEDLKYRQLIEAVYDTIRELEK